MTLREIEERVAAVEPRPGVEYLGDLLPFGGTHTIAGGTPGRNSFFE
ncbi:MAG: hypothetical protein H0W36_03275 [Gemmatimonadetes bacterium]|nr:hypothetical protein [Gemmatimonadota bacterium]